MKKVFNLFLIIIISCPLLLGATNGARYDLPIEIDAESYLLASLDTGEVIFEKNSNTERVPASLTKLMTSYLVFENIPDLDGTMITAPSKIYDELYGLNSSTADIRSGETLSARQLLYAMMLPSSNEAANIVADYLGDGDSKNFFMMMNNTAKNLGMNNTNFSNAHGLFSDNHYSTAYDMFLLAKACYDINGFMDIATSTEYLLPANTKHTSPYSIYTTVRMQVRTSPYYRNYISGMKTGSLPVAGHNFISTSQKNGETYILVVMGANYTDGDTSPAFTATAQIMDFFFDNYTLKNANTLEYPVSEISINYAKGTDNLLLYADQHVMAVLPNEVDESSFQKVYNLPDSVGAPIEIGDVIGTVDYFLAGQKIGTSQLISNIDVERDQILYLIAKLKEFVTSLYFKVLIVLIAICVAGYLALLNARMKKYDKMKKIRRVTHRKR